MRSFSWVIEGELGGMAFPGLSLFGVEQETLTRDISFLMAQGVRSIVTLTEQSLDGAAVREAGLEYLHIPIPDMNAPTDQDIDGFVHFVAECLKSGKPTAVHCAMGIGRTGTMLACYLVSQGCAPSDAIETVRRSRPGSIETHGQEASVVQYGERLAAEMP